LAKAFPNEQLAPLVDVDTFWHYHILDTKKYAADCQLVFGYFLHHYPYLGMGDEADQQALIQSGDRVHALYEATFGEKYGLAVQASRDAQKTAGASAASYEALASFGVTTEPAFCGVSTAPAFCGVSTARASCGVSTAPAFCCVSTAPAFCGISTDRAVAATPSRKDSAADTAFFGVSPRLLSQARSRSDVHAAL
jgi:hypothetical protein